METWVSGNEIIYSSRIPIRSSLDLVQAHQEGRDLARSLGFTAERLDLVSTVISELADNILKNARFGDLIFARRDKGAATGLNICACDAGPGIAGVTVVLLSGDRITGGYGYPVPSVCRLVDEYEIHSHCDSGTTLDTTLWLR